MKDVKALNCYILKNIPALLVQFRTKKRKVKIILICLKRILFSKLH